MGYDARASAANSLATVIADGRAFTGAIDHLKPPKNTDATSLQPTIDSRDIGFYRELCYGTLRHYFYLNAIALSLLKKPFAKKDANVHALLLIGLYQLIYLKTPPHAALNATVDAAGKLKKRWAKGLLNAVLRNYLRAQKNSDSKALPQGAAALSHPDWLYSRLKKAWPQHLQQIIDYNNAAPPMSLRVRGGEHSRSEYLSILAEQGINASADLLTTTGINLQQPVDIKKLPSFNDGRVSVQDIGAQLAAGLLKPIAGQQVLDSCAAPGGKTVHLLEFAPKLLLTAIDHSELRLNQVKQNLERCNFSAKLICDDANNTQSWWDNKPFERILLDAPCSGTGVISHHPDIKLLRRASDISQFAAQQLRLLNQLWPTLAEGGELLYCTCSVMPEENQQVIEQFLASTDLACSLPIDAEWGIPCTEGRQLLPIRGNNGGFFYARLSKRAKL
jgi:16S rRNA (cytosine967-C5)-methyltransferase